ncbi:MAG: HU family DNA-binding protein [Bacteroidetes bacterium]|nr:HU family DNA-binding protein [Bacteroidota bacterium]
MNRAELVESIHVKLGGTKAAAEEALRATLDSITEALNNGDGITLIGFGNFSIVERKERMGHNPQTGESIKIAAKKAIKFVPGKALKEGVNPAKKKNAEAPATKSKRKC